ncbi:hypothetical protein NDU88_008973 [Pleurodeles waltl]|uniref:Uncharacterized protein n=1 Tax=Pleurodeles waltl TaxID=8319 RepID=A0AAV7RVB5_PLEWA|nr:hypothetical protein NDU88_008973 [Pleurodeles waltl]
MEAQRLGSARGGSWDRPDRLRSLPPGAGGQAGPGVKRSGPVLAQSCSQQIGWAPLYRGARLRTSQQQIEGETGRPIGMKWAEQDHTVITLLRSRLKR